MTPADERKARAEDVLEEVYLHLNPDDRVSIITAAIAEAEAARDQRAAKRVERHADGESNKVRQRLIQLARAIRQGDEEGRDDRAGS